MNIDYVGVAFVIGVVFLIAWFGGDPDLADAVIGRLMK